MQLSGAMQLRFPVHVCSDATYIPTWGHLLWYMHVETATCYLFCKEMCKNHGRGRLQNLLIMI
jgi:hypothetical protein